AVLADRSDQELHRLRREDRPGDGAGVLRLAVEVVDLLVTQVLHQRRREPARVLLHGVAGHRLEAGCRSRVTEDGFNSKPGRGKRTGLFYERGESHIPPRRSLLRQVPQARRVPAERRVPPPPEVPCGSYPTSQVPVPPGRGQEVPPPGRPAPRTHLPGRLHPQETE